MRIDLDEQLKTLLINDLLQSAVRPDRHLRGSSSSSSILFPRGIPGVREVVLNSPSVKQPQRFRLNLLRALFSTFTSLGYTFGGHFYSFRIYGGYFIASMRVLGSAVTMRSLLCLLS